MLKRTEVKLERWQTNYGAPWRSHIMERFAKKLWCGCIVKEELTEQLDYVCDSIPGTYFDRRYGLVRTQGLNYGPSWCRVLLDSMSIPGFLAGPLLQDVQTAYAQGYAWFNRFLTNNRIILNRKMLAQLVLTGELTNLVTTSLLMGLVLKYSPLYAISKRHHPYRPYTTLGLFDFYSILLDSMTYLDTRSAGGILRPQHGSRIFK
jgi:hypothetical protein